ncbi:MAG TPA: cytochrome d ubiquinol oxidase subunit II [Solirubrobacterales bacterium]|nr:cytochrome d ubiquinol oxidase subunit II [Solirubrobacterales bacterium]
MPDYTALQVVWFVLIAILWLGYFVLEGFDFGVGMLIRAVGRTDAEKRAVIHTIGPVWDGNEVWLIVAGGATFAAFPQWYATLFSGFYLALFLILVALIVRNVSFEFWGKGESERWRRGWEWAMMIGSGAAALLWGVGWANIVHGVPIDSQMEYTGTLFTLLNPYALLGGVATLLIFLAHGSVFLTLRTEGEMGERARAIAGRVMPPAAAAGIAFLLWTVLDHRGHGGIDVASALLAAVAAVLLVAAVVVLRRSAGRAFAATAGAIVFFFTSLFVGLFPHTMISSTSSAFDMTLNASSSSHYTLVVMTVVAALLVPVVLVYQAWTYWVFRRRVSAEDFGDVRSPLDLLPAQGGDGDATRGGGRKPDELKPAGPGSQG